MANNWDLNNIYTGYDDLEFINDVNYLEKQIDKIRHCITSHLENNDSPVETIFTIMEMMNQYQGKLGRLTTYIKLTMCTNTEDLNATGAFGKVNSINSGYTPLITLLQKYLSSIENVEGLIKCSPKLEEYSFMLTEIIKSSKYQLTEIAETTLSKMTITGSSAWQNLQNKVTSDLFVDIKNNNEVHKVHINALKTLPPPKDKAERLQRFCCEMEAYKSHEIISAACLNGIKGEAISVAEIRGFDSPMHKSVVDCRMETKMVEALFNTIEKNLPNLRGYLKIKAKLLNYENGLPLYEVPAPIGTLTQKFNVDECKGLVLKSFYKFSVEMGDLAKRAFEGDWIDFPPRQGKVGGGFCASIHEVNESRILVNYNGAINDIITVAHELGHAFHSSMLKGQNNLNSDYPIPVAEIASTFCEMVLMDGLLKEAKPDAAFSIINNDLTRASQLTMDILSRYYFEKAVFDKRKERELSAAEINDFMEAGQRKSFGEAIDPKLFHKYMWLNKEHFFYVDRSYYNFSYSFGYLLSVGFYNMYKEDNDKFIKKYYRFLQNSGRMSVKDLCSIMDIDPTKEEFWQKSIDCIVKNMQDFEKLCINSKLI